MRVRSIRDMAAAVRGRRTDLTLSQAELARRAGVSRKWISEFEAGKSTAEFGLVIRVLEELGLVLDLISGEDAAATLPATVVDLDALLDQYRVR
ncbi:MAG TPA: helix-turn-helix domain-containing protein [Chloroflexota bacterium]|nr:helix-turn-helix domain-containing protein [Chloroflexota bacterium]